MTLAPRNFTEICILMSILNDKVWLWNVWQRRLILTNLGKNSVFLQIFGCRKSLRISSQLLRMSHDYENRQVDAEKYFWNIISNRVLFLLDFFNFLKKNWASSTSNIYFPPTSINIYMYDKMAKEKLKRRRKKRNHRDRR